MSDQPVTSSSYEQLPVWQQAQARAIADMLRNVGGYHGSESDALTDAVAIGLAAQFAPPEGDNHHNARLCPYCTGEVPPSLSFDELGDSGVVQEVNRLLLHPIGLALARYEDGTLRVLTDPDPEGWQFDGMDLREKAAAFAARQEEWHARRRAALGFIAQPLDDGGTGG